MTFVLKFLVWTQLFIIVFTQCSISNKYYIYEELNLNLTFIQINFYDAKTIPIVDCLAYCSRTSTCKSTTYNNFNKTCFLYKDRPTSPTHSVYDKFSTIYSTKICTGEIIRRLGGHVSNVIQVLLLRNGNILSAGGDNRMVITNLVTGSQKTLGNYVYPQKYESSQSVVELNNGNLAAGGIDNFTVNIWNVSVANCVYQLYNHTNMITSLVTLNDGNLATGTNNGSINIWNPYEGTLLNILEGHTGRVVNMVVLKDGRLASSSGDKTVKIWSVYSGLDLTLTNAFNSYSSLKLHNDGRLVGCSFRGEIFIWDSLNNFKLLAQNFIRGVQIATPLTDDKLALAYQTSISIVKFSNFEVISSFAIAASCSDLLFMNNTLVGACDDDVVTFWNIN